MKEIKLAKIKLLLVTLSLFISAHFEIAWSAESAADVANELAPLIGKVRGAIRTRIESGKGCLPWVVLARNPSDSTTFHDFGFDRDILKEIEDQSAKGIGKLFTSKAKKDGYESSAVGTCETDVNRRKSAELNVINIVIERKNTQPIKFRFPFELDTGGRVTYLKDGVSIQPTEPVVFLPVRE